MINHFTYQWLCPAFQPRTPPTHLRYNTGNPISRKDKYFHGRSIVMSASQEETGNVFEEAQTLDSPPEDAYALDESGMEYGNTPPHHPRLLKTLKAASRKTGTHRGPKPRRESTNDDSEAANRRHTVSSSKMEIKKKREAMMAERQRHTMSDLSSYALAEVPLAERREQTQTQLTGTDVSEEFSVGNSEPVALTKEEVDSRVGFFKTFSTLIKMGTQRQRLREQGGTTGVASCNTHRHMSQPALSVSSPQHQEYVDALWLELQAYLEGRLLNEHMAFLDQARFQVGSVLDDLMKFSLKNQANRSRRPSPFSSRPMSRGDGKLSVPVVSVVPSQVEEKQIVISENPEESLVIRSISKRDLETDNDLAGGRDNEANKELLSSADTGTGISLSSQSATCSTDEQPNSTTGTRFMTPPIDMPQSRTNSQSSSKMTRQRRISEKSTESTESNTTSPSSSSNFQSFKSVDQLFPDPASCITPEQLEALSAVEILMNRLDKAQSYYPNLQALARDYPLYKSDLFERRLKALNLWYNVMQDLHHKIRLLTTWMDVRVDLRPFSMKTRFLRLQASRRFSLQASRPLSTSVRQNRVQSESLLDDTAAQYYHAMSLPPEFLSKQPQFVDLMESEAVATAFQDEPELLEHLFPSYDFDVDEGVTSRYRKFVDKSLKQMGLSKLMARLSKCLHRTLKRALNTLVCQDSSKLVTYEESLPSMMEEGLVNSPLSPPPGGFRLPQQCFGKDRLQKRRRSSAVKRNLSGLSQEFVKMGLPSFKLPFLRLLCVPVDVIHECMRLRLDHKPQKEPSALCIRQLIAEYKESMQAAVQQKQYFVKMVGAVASLESFAGMRELLESEKDEFEADLKETLEVYFAYLLNYVNMLQTTTQASKGLKNLLEQEWQFVKEIAPYIRGAEAEAGRRFCIMASSLLEMTGDFLGIGLDKCCSNSMCDGMNEDTPSSMIDRRHGVIDECRQCKYLFYEARERASKALGFAKMLRKDLEIAADFACNVPVAQLLQDLKALDHVEVLIPHVTGYMIFVPHSMKDSNDHILQLLNVTCGREETSGMGAQMNDGYMLFLSVPGSMHSPPSSYDTASPPVAETTRESWQTLDWTGPVIEIFPDIETTIGLSEVEVGQLKLIVSNSSLLLNERRAFQHAIGPSVTLIREQTSSHDDVAECLQELKESALKLGEQVLKAVSRVDKFLQLSLSNLNEIERIMVHQQYVEAMLSCFNFGFEYGKEVSRLVNGEQRDAMVPGLIDFAMKWMNFVIGKCERGRGTRPRWATAGLEFLILVGELSVQSQNMTDKQFQLLKGKMNESIDHLIGTKSDPSPQSCQTWWSPSHSPLTVADRRIRVHSPRTPHFPRSCHPLSMSLRSSSFPDAIPSIVTSGSPQGNTKLTIDNSAFLTIQDTKPERDDELTPPNSDSSNSSGVQTNDSPPLSTNQPPAASPSHSQSLLDSSENRLPTPRKLVLHRSASAASNISSSAFSPCSDVTTPGLRATSEKAGAQRHGRRVEVIQNRLEQFDMERNVKLRKQGMIGQVSERKANVNSDIVGMRVRHVNFPWQRGRKIGEGRFGKVYACINMETGDLMAVKEVRFQGSSHSAIKEIVDEIKILEGIMHANVVRYYGVEVHKVSQKNPFQIP
jgi:hypothetical protein